MFCSLVSIPFGQAGSSNDAHSKGIPMDFTLF